MTKFKTLTQKEKAEHIWEYYRFHIIGGVLGGFCILYVLVNILKPGPLVPAANIVIMGQHDQDDQKTEQLAGEIKNIIDQGEDGIVDLNVFSVDWSENSQTTMAMEDKLMLLLQAEKIDILGLEKEKFTSYAKNLDMSIFEPLEKTPGLNQILEENLDNQVRLKFRDEDQEEVYGLFIKDNIKLKNIGLGDDYIISIPKISKQKDNAVQVIQWLYQ